MGNNGEVHEEEEEEEDLHGENQSDRNKKKYCLGSFNEDSADEKRKRRLTPTNGQTCCTFKWSDGRTVETIGAAPPIIHTDRLYKPL
jgi:hypothetical protein